MYMTLPFLRPGNTRAIRYCHYRPSPLFRSRVHPIYTTLRHLRHGICMTLYFLHLKTVGYMLLPLAFTTYISFHVMTMSRHDIHSTYHLAFMTSFAHRALWCTSTTAAGRTFCG